MLEPNRIAGQQPDDYHMRSLSALDRAIAAFAKTNPHIDDLTQATHRKNLYTQYVNGDAHLSWNDIMLARTAFSRTLRRQEEHLVQDAEFIDFLIEQSVYAAKCDGINIQRARAIQPPLPGMIPQELRYQQLPYVDSPHTPIELPTASPPTSYRTTSRTPESALTFPKWKKPGRRKLLEWMGIGSGVAVLGTATVVGVNYLIDENNKAHPFEVEHRLTSRRSPEAGLNNLQFAYPQVAAGTDFINKYGDRSVVRYIPSDGSLGTYIQIALPWDNSDFPNIKKAMLQGITVGTYTDSSGKVVPEIKYTDKTGISRNFVLIGHLTEPEGSFTRDHSDIFEIHSPSTGQPLYISMVVEEVLKPASRDKQKLIKITTLEKNP